MPRDAEPRECSIAMTLGVVGERWALLAIRELLHGVHRFDQIAFNTGASRDILTTRLRKLEESGILWRRPYSERPLRYEYHLTPKGRELGDVLLTLMAWGDRHLADGSPPVVWQHSCGNPLVPVVVCAACGEPARGSHSPAGRGVAGL